MLEKEERDQLYMEVRRKKLKLINLANQVECSPSLLSRYFSHDCNLSTEKEEKLIKTVSQVKEYRWQRVEVE